MNQLVVLVEDVWEVYNWLARTSFTRSDIPALVAALSRKDVIDTGITVWIREATYPAIAVALEVAGLHKHWVEVDRASAHVAIRPRYRRRRL